MRILGCDFIQASGLLLQLPQVAMATAQILFHRFYYAKSIVKHNYEVKHYAAVNSCITAPFAHFVTFQR